MTTPRRGREGHRSSLHGPAWQPSGCGAWRTGGSGATPRFLVWALGGGWCCLLRWGREGQRVLQMWQQGLLCAVQEGP